MAARRVSKSAIDWTAFAKRVPDREMPGFRLMKAQTDKLVQEVHKYPETMPAINWAAYKAKIGTPGVVDALQKAYENINVPYPTDKRNFAAFLVQEEKDELARDEERAQEMLKLIDIMKRGLALIDKVPGPDTMTAQEYFEWFPEKHSFITEPTVWPHRLEDQPGGNPHAPEETWDRVPKWHKEGGKKDGKWRNPLKLTPRDFEPMTHEEQYHEWCLEKATEQLNKWKANNEPEKKLAWAQKLVDEAQAVVDEDDAARKKAYEELDAWRAAGSPYP